MTDRSFGAGAAAQSRTLQKERPKSKTVDIIMGDVAYYHPYPSNSKASKVWKYFRCKRSVEYSEQGHVCIVQNAVHNRLMKIQPKLKNLNVLISLEIA